MSHELGLIFVLHGFLTRDVIEPFPLGEHCPRCSMTPITNKTTEKKTYFPWSLVTQLVTIFTMTTAKTRQS